MPRRDSFVATGDSPQVSLRLDQETYVALEQIMASLPTTRDDKRRRAIIWAIRTAGRGAPPALLADLDEKARQLRETLRGITALDLAPHPCPPQVDPTWWREQQASLHQQTLDQLVVAIERADQQAAAIAATIQEAKKGAAQ